MSVNAVELNGSQLQEKPIDLIPKEHKKLDTDMRAYLEKVTSGMDAETMANESFRERVSYLVKHGVRLEEAASAFENPEIFFSSEEEKKLSEANGSIGPENTGAILEYYKRVESEMLELLAQLRSKGIGYFADKSGKINDESVDKIEMTLKSMIVGYREFIIGTLEKTSPEYANTSIGGSQERSKQLSDFISVQDEHNTKLLNSDSLEFEKEANEILALMEKLSENAPTQEIKQRMLTLTKRIASHMNDDLAAPALTLVGKSVNGKRKRNLEIFNEDPLHQLELLTEVTIRTLKLGSHVRIHKGLIEK